MPATYEQAVDAMLGVFWERWTTLVNPLVGYTPAVVWPKEIPPKPDPAKHWAMVTVQTVTEDRASIRGPNETTRLRSQGFLIVQLHFSQISMQRGHDEKIAEIVKKSFIAPLLDGALEFTNPTKQERPPEREIWFRTNVTATFEYDDII